MGITQDKILLLNTQAHQKACASQTSSTRTADHHAYLFDSLAHYLQGI